MTEHRQRGITLVELISTIVILAVALSGITIALSGGIGRSADIMTDTRAVALAQSYLEEITGKRFDNASNPRGIPPCWAACTDEVNFGPDGGESGRPDYDDVDDFHGLDEGWQSVTGDPLRDPEGNTRTGYENFRVRVTVRYVNVAAGEEEEQLATGILTDERDAKLITVNISHPDNEDGWDFSVYKVNF